MTPWTSVLLIRGTHITDLILIRDDALGQLRLLGEAGVGHHDGFSFKDDPVHDGPAVTHLEFFPVLL